MMFVEQIKALLFKNIGTKQTIAKNVLWLGLADGFSKILKITLAIFIAKAFGVAEYGKFAFALSFVSLFGIFSDLNIAKLITREFAKDNTKEKDFPSILSLEIVLSLATFLILFTYSFFITPDQEIRKLIWLVGIYFLVSIFPEVFYAFFKARQQMQYQAWSSMIISIITTAAAAVVIYFFPTIFNLGLAYLLASILALIFVAVLFNLKGSKLNIAYDFSVWKAYLIISWPLVLTGLVQSICSNFDLTYLGYSGLFAKAGIYSAAQKIANASLIPAGFIAVAFFPALSKAWAGIGDGIQKIWNFYFNVITLAAIPIIVGGLFLSDRIIYFIYGQNFMSASTILPILLLSGVLTLLGVPFRQLMVVADKLKINLVINILSAIINVVLNLLLIPKYSLYGAAFASVITNLFIFIIFTFLNKKYSNLIFFSREIFINLVIVILSSLGMYMIISLPAIYNLNIFITILFGAVIYFLNYFFLKLLYVKFKI